MTSSFLAVWKTWQTPARADWVALFHTPSSLALTFRLGRSTGRLFVWHRLKVWWANVHNMKWRLARRAPLPGSKHNQDLLLPRHCSGFNGRQMTRVFIGVCAMAAKIIRQHEILASVTFPYKLLHIARCEVVRWLKIYLINLNGQKLQKFHFLAHLRNSYSKTF